MEKIKEFEKAAIDAVSALRKELGAKSVSMEIRVNDYEMGCQTNVTFLTSMSNASRVPGCGPACKGD